MLKGGVPGEDGGPDGLVGSGHGGLGGDDAGHMCDSNKQRRCVHKLSR